MAPNDRPIYMTPCRLSSAFHLPLIHPTNTQHLRLLIGSILLPLLIGGDRIGVICIQAPSADMTEQRAELCPDPCDVYCMWSVRR